MANLLRTALRAFVLSLVLLGGAVAIAGADTAPGDILVGNTRLFTLQVPVGSFSPSERAATINARLTAFAESDRPVSAIHAVDADGVSNVYAAGTILFSITDADAKKLGAPSTVLAARFVPVLQQAVEDYRIERTPAAIWRACVQSAIASAVALAILLLVVVVARWLRTRIGTIEIPPGRGILRLISAARVRTSLTVAVNVVATFLAIALLNVYVPYVLTRFPQTRAYGQHFTSQMLHLLGVAGAAILGYLPNLLILVLVAAVTMLVIRIVGWFFRQVADGQIELPGFYTGWASVTGRLVSFFFIAIAVAVALPYLPGSSSPSFQGVSVFIGLVVSLSSSSAISNIIAGVILIYTRSFEVGDRVKIGETVGDVVEKTMLVTRVRTIKNVLISLPNAQVLNSNIENFSASEHGSAPLILHTTVTLGYDIPWRKIHEAMLAAARATPHVLADPAPFVLQTALNDFNVSYQLNAYTDNPHVQATTFSLLHENLQDKCNEAGIEILSPSYASLRDGNPSTIPASYLPPDYRAPGFKIEDGR